MQIRVADLHAEGLKVADRIDPRQLSGLVALQENDACVFKGPLTVTLRVRPTAGMFQVDGHLRGMASLICGRCLAPVDTPLNSTFRLSFARTIPGDDTDVSSETHELQAEELGVVLFEGDAIDFRDVIQEQVIMAIPMQPLCRTECRGLCARCGANLNDGPCDCSQNDVDPRLAILKTLKFDS
jgi:DUF177 domain-containing protein